MTSPITPDEIEQKKLDIIPDQMFEAFNELIALNYNEGRATVLQKDVILLAEKKGILVPIGRPATFNYKWLNVEEIYRQAGWIVEYDKPGYNENYSAFYLFQRK